MLIRVWGPSGLPITRAGVRVVGDARGCGAGAGRTPRSVKSYEFGGPACPVCVPCVSRFPPMSFYEYRDRNFYR
jgi:hypothetical protein